MLATVAFAGSYALAEKPIHHDSTVARALAACRSLAAEGKQPFAVCMADMRARMAAYLETGFPESPEFVELCWIASDDPLRQVDCVIGALAIVERLQRE